MRRHLALACVLLLLGACGEPEPRPIEESRVYEPVGVPDATALSGREIERVDEGPWSLRRVAHTDEPDADATLKKGSRRMAGGAVPPGMREPTDAMAPASAPPPGGAPAPVPRDEATDDHSETDGDEPFAEGSDGGSDKTSDAPFEGPSASSAIGVGGGGGAKAPRRAGRIALARGSAQGAPLKAGTTDDNENFPAFLEFLATWSDQEGVADRYDPIDVRDRRFVRVVDATGRIVPAARVHIVDEGRDAVVLSGTTYGDGRVPFYPRAHAADLAPTPAAKPADGYLVEVRKGDARRRLRWDGEGETLTVALDANVDADAILKLDVCFLIDTTGSMSDEIARIKATLLSVTERLRGLSREFDLKYGAVLYRDLGDEYVTMAHPFTGDIEAFSKALQSVQAAGGGDTPESLNQGLAEGVGRLAWRDGAAKVMFVIADAPAHMDYEGDVKYGTSLRAALDKGIRIHAVAASGLDPFGSLMFRQIAQFTRGKFVFIEYGGNVAASGAKHGVKGAKKSNNLDDILYEQIERELAEWGREPRPTPAGDGADEASDSTSTSR